MDHNPLPVDVVDIVCVQIRQHLWVQIDCLASAEFTNGRKKTFILIAAIHVIVQAADDQPLIQCCVFRKVTWGCLVMADGVVPLSRRFHLQTLSKRCGLAINFWLDFWLNDHHRCCLWHHLCVASGGKKRADQASC